MNPAEIARLRLYNQHLQGAACGTPAEVARWLGAVQAQDFAGSLYAIGLRIQGSTDLPGATEPPIATEASVEQAIADKSVVRSWPMRGTIHIMPTEDARWMLELLAPRQNARSANIYRKAGLTAQILDLAGEVLARELRGGRRLTRPELYQALDAAGVGTAAQGGEQRGMHMLRHWAQECLICITPRRGKQPTFALFDEWVPPGRRLAGEEAVAELALRYLRSHGPATAHDFAWWTGLTLTEARQGMARVVESFERFTVGGDEYWFRERDGVPEPTPAGRPAPTVHLVPPFDEYTVAYADRGAALGSHSLVEAKYGIGQNILVDGQIAGFWRRTIKKDTVLIGLEPLRELTKAEHAAIAKAAQRYAAFVGCTAVLE